MNLDSVQGIHRRTSAPKASCSVGGTEKRKHPGAFLISKRLKIIKQ
jgi:hypothetical protein